MTIYILQLVFILYISGGQLDTPAQCCGYYSDSWVSFALTLHFLSVQRTFIDFKGGWFVQKHSSPGGSCKYKQKLLVWQDNRHRVWLWGFSNWREFKAPKRKKTVLYYIEVWKKKNTSVLWAQWQLTFQETAWIVCLHWTFGVLWKVPKGPINSSVSQLPKYS